MASNQIKAVKKSKTTSCRLWGKVKQTDELLPFHSKDIFHSSFLTTKLSPEGHRRPFFKKYAPADTDIHLNTNTLPFCTCWDSKVWWESYWCLETKHHCPWSCLVHNAFHRGVIDLIETEVQPEIQVKNSFFKMNF